jgi:hypothetical protein
MLASFPASMLNQNLSDLGILKRFNLASSRSSTARLYLNYDGKFRAALQPHQGTVGVELKW